MIRGNSYGTGIWLSLVYHWYWYMVIIVNHIEHISRYFLTCLASGSQTHVPLLSLMKHSSRKLYVGSSKIKLLSTHPVQLFLGNNGSLCQRNKTCLSWFGCRQCVLVRSNYCFGFFFFFLTPKTIRFSLKFSQICVHLANRRIFPP